MTKNKTILVVDDESSIRENVSEYLREFNFKTILSENGIDAFQKAIEYQPDLILCDIDMPGMDGYELYKKIQQLPDLSLTPFIFLTAKSTNEELRKGMLLGADDYITKPFKLIDVLQSINRRLEKADHINKTSNLKLQTLLENNLVGVFFYQSNKFTFTNKKFLEILGYSKSEILNLSLNDIITGEEKNTIIDKFIACNEGITASCVLEASVKTKDQNLFNVSISIHHIIIDNQKSIIGIMQTEDRQGVRSNTENIFTEIIEHFRTNNEPEIAQKIKSLMKDSDIKRIEKFEKEIKKIKFTKREQEVLALICQGMTNNEIADKIFLSKRTVENHRAKLLSKTNSKNTAQLVLFGIKYLSL